MKNIVNSVLNKERKLKQKTKKIKYHSDGILKKTIEREIEYEQTPAPEVSEK